MPKFPTEPSATKLRNHLVRYYGGRAFKSMSIFSNPYSKHQSLLGEMRENQVKKAREDLHNEGWTMNQDMLTTTGKLTTFPYHKGQASITFSKGRDNKWLFDCQGIKKQKQSTIPYYD